jgi:tripartite-type tricarboxylate transporter receptor subunit TctC
MNTVRRITSCLLAVAALGFAAITFAQDFPAKPVRIVVGFPPGGSNDLVARALGLRMSAALGQQVLVDNRPGANGIIAAEHVAKSPADGYTVILTGVSTYVLNPLLYAKVPYDTLADFSPITTVAAMPQVLVAHPQLPVKSLKDVAALAQRSPGALTAASPGVGGISHLTLEMFTNLAKVKIEHVAYKGTAPALTDLVGGQIPLLVCDLPAPLPYVKAGRIRALVVTGPQRSPLLPDVATALEQGYPGLQATNWLGVMAPARTPPAVVDRLNAAFVAAVNAPETKERYATVGVDAATFPTGAAFGAFVRDEFGRWEKVVKQSGVQLTQ